LSLLEHLQKEMQIFSPKMIMGSEQKSFSWCKQSITPTVSAKKNAQTKLGYYLKIPGVVAGPVGLYNWPNYACRWTYLFLLHTRFCSLSRFRGSNDAILAGTHQVSRAQVIGKVFILAHICGTRSCFSGLRINTAHERASVGA
jgi:hypothetical protein